MIWPLTIDVTKTPPIIGVSSKPAADGVAPLATWR
jgi:hypothetical protein